MLLFILTRKYNQTEIMDLLVIEPYMFGIFNSIAFVLKVFSIPFRGISLHD